MLIICLGLILYFEGGFFVEMYCVGCVLMLS